MAQIVEFAVFSLPVSALQDRIAAAGKAAGLVAQYAGAQIEDPAKSVHVTLWATAEDHQAATTTTATTTTTTPLVQEVLRIDKPEALTKALESPTTEVFTGYGAELPAFLDSTKKFHDLMDASPTIRGDGYFAGAVLATTAAVQLGADADSKWAGDAVKLVIGWTSREAHLALKGKPGPVSDNIALLRSGIKAGNLYHVNFTKQ